MKKKNVMKITTQVVKKFMKIHQMTTSKEMNLLEYQASDKALLQKQHKFQLVRTKT